MANNANAHPNDAPTAPAKPIPSAARDTVASLLQSLTNALGGVINPIEYIRVSAQIEVCQVLLQRGI